jgi:predicted nucleic acid-binding protein
VIWTKRLKQIETLCAAVPVFPVDVFAAAFAGKLFTELKAQGKTVGNQDLLIAGICLARSVPLLTRNEAHFAKISEISLLSLFGLKKSV